MMTKSSLVIRKFSKTVFLEKLCRNKLEDLNLVKVVEAYLLKKRGYIFRMPKAGSPVILLVSGGLDSTIVWGLLLHKFRFQVYPVFFRRGGKRSFREEASLDYFANYYRVRYSNRYKQPFKLSTQLPPKELEDEILNQKYLHPQRILDSLNAETGTVPYLNIGVLPYLYPFLAAAYSRFLFNKYNLKISHLFSAVTPGDGNLVPSQTFTALRTTMLDMCIASGDYNWQFTSFLLEKEIGHRIEKFELIRLGQDLGLPLEKTRSCYGSSKYHCGDRCKACEYRINEFRKSGIIDRTRYMDKSGLAKKLMKLRSLLTRLVTTNKLDL